MSLCFYHYLIYAEITTVFQLVMQQNRLSAGLPRPGTPSPRFYWHVDTTGYGL